MSFLFCFLGTLWSIVVVWERPGNRLEFRMDFETLPGTTLIESTWSCGGECWSRRA